MRGGGFSVTQYRLVGGFLTDGDLIDLEKVAFLGQSNDDRGLLQVMN